MKSLGLFSFLLAFLSLHSQVVSKVGCGEYGRYILRASDHTVYEDWWNGRSVVLAPVDTKGKKIIDISGALYSAVGIDEDGYAWVFGQGSIQATKIGKDSSGALFNRNISCAGYFGSYVTLRSDGSIWIWGKDAWLLYSDNKLSDIPSPVKIKAPPGIKFKKIQAGNVLVALSMEGGVYEYYANKGIPIKRALPRPACDIAVSHTGFYIAIVPDKIKKDQRNNIAGSMGYPYGWGFESIFFGSSGSITTPVPLKSIWGIHVPIKKITANHNAIHFIDSLGRLFGMGDNSDGEIGNGEELVNHAELYPTPYAWSWAKHEYLVSKPVEIGKGIKWKDIWSGNSFAFYHYAIDENDSLYFWGRSKSWVSGMGHNMEGVYPNAFDVLSPKMIHPFSTPHTYYPNFEKFTCNAGDDKIIFEDTVQLTGKAMPSTGYTIAAYRWTKVTGPTCVIDSPANSKTIVRKLSKGIYQFSLQIRDNNTATISDTVKITVGQSSH